MLRFGLLSCLRIIVHGESQKPSTPPWIIYPWCVSVCLSTHHPTLAIRRQTPPCSTREENLNLAISRLQHGMAIRGRKHDPGAHLDVAVVVGVQLHQERGLGREVTQALEDHLEADRQTDRIAGVREHEAAGGMSKREVSGMAYARMHPHTRSPGGAAEDCPSLRSP